MKTGSSIMSRKSSKVHALSLFAMGILGAVLPLQGTIAVGPVDSVILVRFEANRFSANEPSPL